MTNAHTGEVASLGVARAKLAKVIELHTPHNAARNQALEAFGRALLEYEAAVREDERDRHGDLLATAQAEAVDLQARAHADRVRAESAEAALAAGPVDMSPPPPAPISVPEPEAMQPKFDAALPGTDANGSPVEVTHAALVAPELADPGAHIVTEEKPTKRKK